MSKREQQPSATPSAGIEVSVEVGVSATGTVRTNLAVPHMLAAARFSRAVSEIEQRHAGEEFGAFWEEIFHLSIASIFASTASLEAYANELFFDRFKFFPGFSDELLDQIWETFEQKPILEKFSFALLLRGKPQMERGASPYQDVAALIRLRNGLTHFKPEWVDVAVDHRKISEGLKNRFTPSPFLSDELLFPRQWATHGATKWALESCLGFAQEFEKRADLPPKYNRAERQQHLTP